MQLSEIKENVNKLNKDWRELKETNDQRLRQLENKGSADPLTVNKLDKINNDLDEQKSRLRRIELRDARPAISETNSRMNCEYKEAFTSYLRKGNDAGISNLSKKGLSSSSGSEGGYLVDNAMYKVIATDIESNSIMRKLASIQEISTDSFDVLSGEGQFDSGWVAESDTRKETQSGDFNKQNIKVHEIYAQPKVTQKLIDDAKIDISKWVSEQVAERFLAAENHSFINGDGINKPKGILAHGNNIEALKVQSDGKVDADSIVKLYYSLDVKYSGNASFLMHRDMLQQIRLLKSKETGQYLWNPGIDSSAPDTLLGVPVYESPDMPTPKKDAPFLILADFKSAYMIVDRAGISLMRDPFTEKPFVKFYTTKRVGGDIINSKAVKILKL